MGNTKGNAMQQQRELSTYGILSTAMEPAPSEFLEDESLAIIWLFKKGAFKATMQKWADALGLANKGSVSKYINGDHNMSMDLMVRAQRLAKTPVLLQYMAKQLGYKIVPLKQTEIEILKKRINELERSKCISAA